MPKYLIILWLLPLFISAQHELKVKVSGVESSSGKINIGLYNSEESFLNPERHFKGIIVTAEAGSTTGTFTDVPQGTYAIAVFHDENNNVKLDSNFFGIPKEPIGFSIGKVKTFGPPDYQECSFELRSNMEITIPIN